MREHLVHVPHAMPDPVLKTVAVAVTAGLIVLLAPVICEAGPPEHSSGVPVSAPEAVAQESPTPQPTAKEPARRVAEPGDLAMLGWLAGAWMARGPDWETEEHWLAAKGGLMLGLHRTVRSGRKAFFEYLRIEAGPEGIAYIASPSGSSATAFRLTESSPGRAVFENLEHDFPQRILYWLDETGALRGRAEGTKDGKTRGEDWKWERVR